MTGRSLREHHDAAVHWLSEMHGDALDLERCDAIVRVLFSRAAAIPRAAGPTVSQPTFAIEPMLRALGASFALIELAWRLPPTALLAAALRRESRGDDDGLNGADQYAATELRSLWLQRMAVEVRC